MSDLSTRILSAVQGDSATIQMLATAVARHDADSVQGILASRGVPLSAEEVASLLSQVGQGSDPAACTCTCTCT
ncbi:MAG: hypothetical protein U0271_04125 [Polyangiaceae bacterium]